MNVQKSEHVPKGKMVLVYDKQVVWAGDITESPPRIIVDVAILNPIDYERFHAYMKRKLH